MPAGLPSINTEHQGTSTQGVVAGFDITMQRTTGTILLGCSESGMSKRTHLPLWPKL